ncbi:septum site-determining protein MinC [Oceanobacillus piezotolerans]|uniref:Probable septum site-determining protein MinC n=1 Tax=Oceanobacillus piezotolerans TaxID=2448030 RepID=A0A498D9H3_9BACI|nr:septum site-determining protein MinC [Oceanobacillus piezotolerans]RLL47963.1 septum site-determining protein MinC [Oceanobacillus piezotolerans]
MREKKQLITIKGTREGITLFIDEYCSFIEAMKELHNKIIASKPKDDEPIVSVKVKLGNRYLTEDQEKHLRKIINEKNRFTIISIESDVILKEDALKWKEESKINAVNQIVRSGQVLTVKGDLLLIGDVNPGGKVVSAGNIYIMGNLYGIAHAGVDGDRNAFIVASYMKPTQLRIADYLSRAPDYESDGVYMECGLIDEDEDKIIIDRLQVLSHKRKGLSRFERRVQNG